MRSLPAILLAIAVASNAHAQASPWPTETFKSTKLNEERTIVVATPTDYGTSKAS